MKWLHPAENAANVNTNIICLWGTTEADGMFMLTLPSGGEDFPSVSFRTHGGSLVPLKVKMLLYFLLQLLFLVLPIINKHFEKACLRFMSPLGLDSHHVASKSPVLPLIWMLDLLSRLRQDAKNKSSGPAAKLKQKLLLEKRNPTSCCSGQSRIRRSDRKTPTGRRTLFTIKHRSIPLFTE